MRSLCGPGPKTSGRICQIVSIFGLPCSCPGFHKARPRVNETVTFMGPERRRPIRPICCNSCFCSCCCRRLTYLGRLMKLPRSGQRLGSPSRAEPFAGPFQATKGRPTVSVLAPGWRPGGSLDSLQTPSSEAAPESCLIMKNEFHWVSRHSIGN